MPNRSNIYDMYLSDFGAFKTAQEYMNPNFITTDDTIRESIKGTKDRFISFMPQVVLSQEEEIFVINKIKSVYSVYQEEGYAILGDYEHDYDWYQKFLNSEICSTYYWDRYKNYLKNIKHFPVEIIDTLENKTLFKLMSYLGNPNDESRFSVRGLVVGDVQSGKTSNYLGLLTKAADAGYRVIFILTGTIESLRKQTQQRVEEGFIGWDTVNAIPVGVGASDSMPKAFTSRAKDFTGTDNQNTTYKLSNYSSEPMIFVLKKNVSVLKKVYSSLKNINTTATQTKINYPALIIDDEADNASINTNKADDDPTKINKYIRNLLSLFTRSSYVGFTATPFANVFISYDKKDEMLNDDLFPRDFIYALNSPSNYCGAKKYFVEKNNNIEFIKDANDEIFPMRHTKEWDGDRLFGSLYEAIRSFLLANAIRDIRDVNKNTHRSMLINMSRFTKVQSSIMNIVEEYFKEVKRSVKQTHKLPASVALSNPIIQSLKQTFDNEYTNLEVNVEKITWQKVFSQLYDSISKIKVVVVNSSKNSSKLNYDDAKDGLRVIAVGGLALSRGLTLEGLMTSYFYRNTATFDVLMQMGRWFGYREGYADLCRIWLTETSYYFYSYIYLSTEALKSDIKTMGQEKRKPEDFGIRVMNDSIELGITAANKMRNTLQRVEKTFFGSVFETPYIVRDLDAVENNIDNTLAFLKKLSMEQRDYSITQHPYFRDVNVEDVKKLLSSLNIPNANATYFDKKQILSQMKQNASSISKFDVLIIGGQNVVGGVQNPHRFRLDSLDINIPLVGRSFDIKDDTIRMSKSRLRLGGSSDTRYGLSDDQIPLTHTKAQDYLIEGRNPLLIIYFIRPTNVADEADFIYSFDSDNNDKNAQKKLIKELGTRKYGYLVGFGLGIPRKLGVSTKSTMFTVNKTVNYYDKDHDNESEEIS